MRWQPIETAPKSKCGRRKVIDVWCVTDDHESAKFYFSNTMRGVRDEMRWQGRVSEVYWQDGAWRPATGLRMHALTVTPTHWMPLPDPPTPGAIPTPETTQEPLTYYVDGSGFACESKTGRRLRGDEVVAALNQRAAPAPATGDLVARLREEVRRIDLSYSERFEEDAEAFYRATGFMAPGKSVPMEMAAGQDLEARESAWAEWALNKRDEFKSLLREAADTLEGK